jgi:hypothetical protein
VANWTEELRAPDNVRSSLQACQPITPVHDHAYNVAELQTNIWAGQTKEEKKIKFELGCYVSRRAADRAKFEYFSFKLSHR